MTKSNTDKHVEESAHSDESSGHDLVHEHTIYAEPIAHIGSFAVTNALLNSWLAVIVIVLMSWAIRRRLAEIPRGIQNVAESVIESFIGIFDSVTGSREKSFKFLPIVLSFFFIILVNNWLGLLPGVGSVGQVVAEHGQKVFVPYFRGGTADLNTTLALAAIAVVISHVFGVLAVGWWHYLNKFVNIQAFLDIPSRVRKDPAILIVNPIKAFVGLIEIVGELAKIASLSFRLFGNIFAGEVLLASMSAILAFGLPIPFMFLEVVVGLIQALIFSMLTLAYLTMSTSEEAH